MLANASADAVNRCDSVARVVLTSSVAAIYGNPHERGPAHEFTEEDWNLTARPDCLPYYYSKRVAEEKAWEMAKAQSRWVGHAVLSSHLSHAAACQCAAGKNDMVVYSLGFDQYTSGRCVCWLIVNHPRSPNTYT